MRHAVIGKTFVHGDLFTYVPTGASRNVVQFQRTFAFLMPDLMHTSATVCGAIFSSMPATASVNAFNALHLTTLHIISPITSGATT